MWTIPPYKMDEYVMDMLCAKNDHDPLFALKGKL